MSERIRRLGRWGIALVAAVALIGAVAPAPAHAESGWFSNYKNYYTGGGSFELYVSGDYHGWWCSGGLKHCVDLNNLYADNWKFGGTTPNLMRVREKFEFGGYLMNISWYAGFESIPNGCDAGEYSYGQAYSTYVSSFTQGLVCGANTYAAITGVWATNTGHARYSSSWVGTSVTASHNVAGDL